ncbi:HEPN family nuclease [Chelativorans intermedius]|uniref:HEPN family nuclease n=1 Tax=Chelativorans intermedius TaxID=515947 RepID=A0ABV6D7W7_9HYPH|nr:HEPN family nuclease [Chelativorans intermedius]MCT8999936.1 HEPN family nuclease [Chelativorans intermedius]
MEIDRNTIEGFARRARKNLYFMLKARERGEDIHIITHLANSLLGLIVFPYAHFADAGWTDFSQIKLDDLEAEGWPSWSFHLGRSENLRDLLRHLRNALSHRRVQFSSDGRELAEVTVTFWDRRNPAGPDDWSAAIGGEQLLEFTLRLANLIDGEQ